MNYKIFTYGTLMKNQSRNNVLIHSIFLGNYFLKDYCLYEVGTYPAAIQKKNYIVYGEVYEIDEETKRIIDGIEDEGNLYVCKKAIVQNDYGEELEVLFYEYNKDVSNLKIRLPFGKWNKYRIDINDYVWYASYGSNILRDRFLRYISLTESKRIPLLEKEYTFNHPMYFANNVESSNWGHTGVSFLDMNSKGYTKGWMYLITKQQFKEINEKEGTSDNWYNDAPVLGVDEWEIEIKTMTNKKRFDYVKPCTDYMDIIAAGLMERGLFVQLEAIEEYFNENYVPNIDDMHIKQILNRLKN